MNFSVHMHSRFSKVFFVNASSYSTINADLANIAVVEDLGNTHQDTVDWLCGLSEEWLVIFDNADDINLDIQHYFPPCSHGNIIITTRNVNLRIYAEDSSCDTTRLSPNDALDLFLRVARLYSSDESTNKLAASFVKVRVIGYLYISSLSSHTNAGTRASRTGDSTSSSIYCSNRMGIDTLCRAFQIAARRSAR